jgi:hypothetical protein
MVAIPSAVNRARGIEASRKRIQHEGCRTERDA